MVVGVFGETKPKDVLNLVRIHFVSPLFCVLCITFSMTQTTNWRLDNFLEEVAMYVKIMLILYFTVKLNGGFNHQIQIHINPPPLFLLISSADIAMGN